MDDQFPDVVNLNIRGVNKTALLSTLTKDYDSLLAALFTGRQPVFKDEKGRYFIDVNPTSFDQILLFLRDGQLPDIHGVRTSGFGFGAFGGGGGGLFGRPSPIVDDTEIRALYKEASYLRIKELVKALEDYKPILMEKRLDAYRKSRRSYDESLSRILSTITGEEILYGMNLIVQLRQETQTMEEPKCCDHNCIDDSSRTFGHSQNAWETDAVVSISTELDVPMFKMLFTDLQNLGYNIQGRLAMCSFRCSKKSKKSNSGFMFGNNSSMHCCMEKLFLIQFTLANSLPGNMVQFQPAHRGGGLFGAAPAQCAGFGTVATKNNPPQTSLFGSKVDQQNEFKPGTLFGGSSNSPQQPQQQQQQQQQPQKQTGGFSFGGQPTFGGANTPSFAQQSASFGQSTSQQNQALGSFTITPEFGGASKDNKTTSLGTSPPTTVAATTTTSAFGGFGQPLGMFISPASFSFGQTGSTEGKPAGNSLFN